MNNEQFRKLMLAKEGNSTSPGNNAAPQMTPRSATSSLGSRLKSSIPMTPRSVAGSASIDFARQLAERNATTDGRPTKKARISAPKGSQFANGYVDRARARQEEEEREADAAEGQGSKAARIKALEESLKKEEIDQDTFEKLRSEIAGGDLASTHLIKGLDLKLLKRVRAGEDVYGDGNQDVRPEGEDDAAAAAAAAAGQDDVDEEEDAFDALESQEVTAIAKDRPQKKKGQLATVPVAPGQKRSRDQILAAMKAARDAAKAKADSSTLGSKFKKIGAKIEPGTRIERDARGREVLIITDEDGHEKRKVRKVGRDVGRFDQVQETQDDVPDTSAEVLGMEVPEYFKKKQQEEDKLAALQEDEEVHVFSDAGSDYDPLKGLESESEDGEASDTIETPPTTTTSKPDQDSNASLMPPPPPPKTTQPRKYFSTPLTSEITTAPAPSLNDPAVLAALRKAKTLTAAAKSEEEEQEAARQKRLKEMMASSARDADDLDMGFGTDRNADDEEADDEGGGGGVVKLSAWGGDDDGQDGGKGGGGNKGKRKRQPKKKKGDGENMADVMRVLEQRKTGGGSRS